MKPLLFGNLSQKKRRTHALLGPLAPLFFKILTGLFKMYKIALLKNAHPRKGARELVKHGLNFMLNKDRRHLKASALYKALDNLEPYLFLFFLLLFLRKPLGDALAQ